jgi:hypothetical protein
MSVSKKPRKPHRPIAAFRLPPSLRGQLVRTYERHLTAFFEDVKHIVETNPSDPAVVFEFLAQGFETTADEMRDKSRST